MRPWQTESNRECQDDLLEYARKRGIPVDVPWRELTAEQQRWVIEGEGPWDKKTWYGVRRFFKWLEGRSYKMHVRVLLSKYRSYTPCPECDGARLEARGACCGASAHRSVGKPGLNIHDCCCCPSIDAVISSRPSCCLPRSMKQPTCCSAKCARGSISWCAWASAT